MTKSAVASYFFPELWLKCSEYWMCLGVGGGSSTCDTIAFSSAIGATGLVAVSVNGAFFSAVSIGENMLIADNVALICHNGGTHFYCF